MNFTPPVPGVTVGPEWAEDLNDILNQNIAEHTHTAGSGVPLTQASLNITNTLPMNNQALGNSKAVQLTAQGSAPALAGAIYNSGGNLYYRNGSSQNVQITSGSGLATISTGGITGLASSDGGANYAAGEFTWTKTSGTQYATMENGPIKVYSGTDVSPANYTNIVTVAGLAATTTLTMPTVDVKLPTTLPSTNTRLPLQFTASSKAVEPYILKYQSSNVTNGSASVAGVTLLDTTFIGTDKPIVVSLMPKVSEDCYFQLANAASGFANNSIRATITVRLANNTGKQFVLNFNAYDPDNAGIGYGFKFNPTATWFYVPTAGETSSGINVKVITTVNNATNFNAFLNGCRVVIREVENANAL
jgi:hypothetical protein